MSDEDYVPDPNYKNPIWINPRLARREQEDAHHDAAERLLSEAEAPTVPGRIYVNHDNERSMLLQRAHVHAILGQRRD